jgi:hypothetical protein
MRMKYLSHSPSNPPSLLRKAGAIIATTALAGMALMFSALLLVFVISIGAVAFAYLWWKTRELRKQMWNMPARGAAMESEVFEGEVIEGEVVRVEEPVGRINGNRINR